MEKREKVESFVSVILPVYNAEKYVVETINSVLNQTYKNFELIIINDASTDSSLHLINSFSDLRLKIVNMVKNSGVSAARNKGLDLCKGEYVAFIDSDDIWEKNKLEIQLEIMKKNNYSFTFTEYTLYSENTGKKKYVSIPSKVDYKKMLKGNPIACFTVVFHKTNIPMFRFTPEKHEDYIAWLAILKEVPYLYGINKNLGRYRKHDGSITSSKLKSSTWVWSIYRNVEKMTLLQSILCFSNYFLYGVKKHFFK